MSSFLLDTNVVSEWVKPAPHAAVIQWLHTVDEDRVSLSVITVAEIRHGIERLADGPRRARLTTWLEVELPSRFGSRILAVDAPVAHVWGRIVATCYRRGNSIGVMDAFLAATATIHELTLVTCNDTHFEHTQVLTFNPWTTEHHENN